MRLVLVYHFGGIFFLETAANNTFAYIFPFIGEISQIKQKNKIIFEIIKVIFIFLFLFYINMLLFYIFYICIYDIFRINKKRELKLFFMVKACNNYPLLCGTLQVQLFIISMWYTILFQEMDFFQIRHTDLFPLCDLFFQENVQKIVLQDTCMWIKMCAGQTLLFF